MLPYISHQEIEGSSQIAIRDARSDDPTIARVISTTHEFEVGYRANEPAVLVFGVRTGSTMLRLYDSSGDDKGTLRIDVVAQEP